jgi:hypothetical protein
MQYYERAKSIPWKTPPHCNATSSKFNCWQYTCRQVSFSRHSPHPNPPIGPLHGIAWFITQITRFQLSTVQWPHSLHHFRRRLAFTGEIFGLWAAALPWNPIPLNSRRTVTVLAGQFVALQNSRVIVSLDVWRVSRNTFFNARRYLSVIKRGLPGRGFVVVVPSRFHFTITSPAVDLGSLRMAAVNFLLMWQPITSPRSKSLSSPDLLMLLVLLSNEQNTAFCLFYTGKCGHSDI